MEKKRLRYLDSWRGAAALIVLWHHIFVKFPHLFQSWPSWLFDLGNLISNLNVESVIFFFLLSGISIGLSVDQKQNQSGFYRNYYLKRIFRIVPIYWLALLISGLVFYREHGFVEWNNLLGNLLFLQTSANSNSWFTPFAGNGPLWSISYEWFYYLTFPLVHVFYSRVKPKAVVLLLSLLLVSLLSVGVNKISPSPFVYFINFMIVWYLGFFISTWEESESRAKDRFYLALGIAGLFYVIYGHTWLFSATLNSLSKGFMMAAILNWVFHQRGSETNNGGMKWNFFPYVGDGSYAIYALHMPLLILFAQLHWEAYIFPMLPIFFILCYYTEKNLAKLRTLVIR